MRRSIVALALSTTLAGCFELDLGLGPMTWDDNGCFFCIDFDLMTTDGYVHFLHGDTLRVRVLSTMGHDTAQSWSVTGDALRLVDGSQHTTSISSKGTSVLVRAVAVGEGSVKAVAANATLDATLSLRVVDSASITAINLVAPPQIVLKVGETIWVGSSLMSANIMIPWTPPRLTITDTAVVQQIDSVLTSHYPIAIRGIKPGVADVSAAFRGLRKTVTVTVTN